MVRLAPPRSRLAGAQDRERRQKRGVLCRIVRTRLAGLGLVVVALVVVMAATANVIAPYDPSAQDYSALMQPPSQGHTLGTDDVGRDILSRIIYGSRISLEVGLVSIGLSTVAGVLMGLMAGYWGGATEEVLMRLADALYSFPALILALAVAAALGPGIGNAMIAIGIVNVPPFARLVHAQTLSIREREFVLAARALGLDDVTIILRHIWPNVTAPVVVQASLSVSFAILYEASLSFLGVGVRPPEPSWGSMLNVGYQYLEQAPWLSIFPGLAIFVTVLSLNFLGDGIRVALDPRLSEVGA